VSRPDRPGPAGLSAALSATALVAAVLAALAAPSGAIASGAADPNSWSVYHGDSSGHGVSSAAVSFDTASPAWTSPALDGSLFGEPLVADGRVFVATADDRVYALASAGGGVVWSTRVGTAVPASSLPCGDIQPTVGITGTPVIDEGRGEIFVVADELVQGRPAHVLVGLSTATGQVEMTDAVDPPGALSSALLQRTGLALDGGQVVFGFGGNYGDCSTYRGWVVAVGESGGTPRDFAVDAAPGEERGAIWMGGGAPAIDGEGNIWVSAGNGSVTTSQHAYDYSDSVLELSPTLRLVQFFAPRDWAADNAADLDLSVEPVLLADGRVVIAGKSRTAFLLDAAHLGGIGGQLTELTSVCPDDVSGGGAVVGTVVYLPCTTGVVAVGASSSPPGLSMLWSSGAGGGPPIVAGGLVWTIGRNGELYGLDPATGGVRQQAAIGPPDNHFPTPSAGDGLLLVPSSHRVEAFTATALGAATTTPRTSPSTGTTGPVPGRPTGAADTGGLPVSAVAGLAAAVATAVGMAAWLLWRRRVR
jgi:outer membrane protein assembly factor BamB